jgi:hypothetical protein
MKVLVISLLVLLSGCLGEPEAAQPCADRKVAPLPAFESSPADLADLVATTFGPALKGPPQVVDQEEGYTHTWRAADRVVAVSRNPSGDTTGVSYRQNTSIENPEQLLQDLADVLGARRGEMELENRSVPRYTSLEFHQVLAGHRLPRSIALYQSASDLTLEIDRLVFAPNPCVDQESARAIALPLLLNDTAAKRYGEQGYAEPRYEERLTVENQTLYWSFAQLFSKQSPGRGGVVDCFDMVLVAALLDAYLGGASVTSERTVTC